MYVPFYHLSSISTIHHLFIIYLSNIYCLSSISLPSCLSSMYLTFYLSIHPHIYYLSHWDVPILNLAWSPSTHLLTIGLYNRNGPTALCDGLQNPDTVRSPPAPRGGGHGGPGDRCPVAGSWGRTGGRWQAERGQPALCGGPGVDPVCSALPAPGACAHGHSDTFILCVTPVGPGDCGWVPRSVPQSGDTCHRCHHEFLPLSLDSEGRPGCLPHGCPGPGCPRLCPQDRPEASRLQEPPGTPRPQHARGSQCPRDPCMHEASRASACEPSPRTPVHTRSSLPPSVSVPPLSLPPRPPSPHTPVFFCPDSCHEPSMTVLPVVSIFPACAPPLKSRVIPAHQS